MTHREWHGFREVLARQTGLSLRDRDLHEVGEALARRLRAVRLTRFEDYLLLLQSDTARAQAEWEQLMPLVTNSETYFLRDQGQHDLLRQQLLPEIIERRSAENRSAENRSAERPTEKAAERTLRVWSAGCSNGEEAYSLAILLDELLPVATREREGWQVSIWGTDINEAALEIARRGVYGSWSLRSLSAAMRTRYFQEPNRETAERNQEREAATHGKNDDANGRNDRFEIKPHLRAGVTFGALNLCADFPAIPTITGGFDLILCRNVLIYFERETVARVVAKLAAHLNQGGYLLTGHAELHHQDLGALGARLLPGSVVYQRAEVLPARSENALPPRVAATPTNVSPTSVSPVGVSSDGVAAYSKSRFSLPPVLPTFGVGARETENRAARCHASWCDEAARHADAGRYEAATHCCEQAISIRADAPAPYLLLARIAEERGNGDLARALLRKAIYLAPTCVAAYLELGALCGRQGNVARARQMRAAALELLEEMPRDSLVEGLESCRAGELEGAVRALLAT